jgi:hypothetical protein
MLEMDDNKNGKSINSIIFWVSISLGGLALFLFLNVIFKGIDKQNGLIDKYKAEIKQTNEKIKQRDRQIDSLIITLSGKDRIISLYQDTINKAYEKISKINKQQLYEENKKKKIIADVSRLDLPSKIKFISSGGN